MPQNLVNFLDLHPGVLFIIVAQLWGDSNPNLSGELLLDRSAALGRELGCYTSSILTGVFCLLGREERYRTRKRFQYVPREL